MFERNEDAIRSLEYLLNHISYLEYLTDKSNRENPHTKLYTDMNSILQRKTVEEGGELDPEVAIDEKIADLDNIDDKISEFENITNTLSDNTEVINDFVKVAKNDLELSYEEIYSLLRGEKTLEDVASQQGLSDNQKKESILNLQDALKKAQEHPLIIYSSDGQLSIYIDDYRPDSNFALNQLDYMTRERMRYDKIGKLRNLKTSCAKTCEVLKQCVNHLQLLKQHFSDESLKLNDLLNDLKRLSKDIHKPIVANETLSNLQRMYDRYFVDNIIEVNTIDEEERLTRSELREVLLRRRTEQGLNYLFDKYIAAPKEKSSKKVSFSEEGQLRVYTASKPISPRQEQLGIHTTDSDKLEDEKLIDFTISLKEFDDTRPTLMFNSRKSRSTTKKTRNRYFQLGTHEARAHKAIKKADKKRKGLGK